MLLSEGRVGPLKSQISHNQKASLLVLYGEDGNRIMCIMKSYNPLRIVCTALLLPSLLCVGACGKKEVQTEEIIPSVKCYTVSDQAVGQERRLSGKVIAGETAPLSFSVSGTVKQVLVDRGDRVRQGQVLAVLDSEPMNLAVEQSRGQLVAAREKVIDTKSQLDNIDKLFSQGAASQLEFDTATTNYATAQANLQSAQADLDRKQLDLKRTQLVAPSSGQIAERSIEPFQEVTVGQTAFVLESAGSFKVEVLVPETLIRDLDYGQTVGITFPTLEAQTARGTIQTIGTQAEAGNAYPVEIFLTSQKLELRSGMTASVTFRFDEYLDNKTVYMIPISSIAVEVDINKGRQPGPDAEGVRRSPVYVLNEEAGQVEIREVVIGGLRGNMLEVFEGLKPGEQVVSAGVPFVRDKMKAKRWTPDKGLSDG